MSISLRLPNPGPRLSTTVDEVRTPPPLRPPGSRVKPAQPPLHGRRPAALPARSPLLLRWFTRYCRSYLRRHFHSVRISRAGLPACPDHLPLVVYGNHASWWDPLVALLLKEALFPGRALYAPMDAAMLARYRLFAKLGFFGVTQGCRRGAVEFLRASEAILQSRMPLLALTPQGQFVDVRQRPVRFEAGLGHLAARAERALFLPMAAEFVYWEERLPEILVRFGEPIEAGRACGPCLGASGWTARFEHQLESVQDALALEVRRRDPVAFEPLLWGGAGQGGIYDIWRGLIAFWRGDHFRKEHGNR